jgi:mRNA interferase RelE/StbE
MSGHKEGTWTISYEKRAEKDVARLDPPVRKRVLAALGGVAEDPNTESLRKLTGRTQSRLRVGDWRVIVEIDNNTKEIQVQRVLPRGRAYDR